MPPGDMIFGRFNMQVPGVVESLSSQVGSGNCRMGLYYDNSGAPGALIAQTGVVGAGGWVTGSIGNNNLPAGNYWIGVLSDSGYTWASNQSGSGCYYLTGQAFGPLPTNPTGGSDITPYNTLLAGANYCPLAPTFTNTSTPAYTPTVTLTPNPTCAMTPGTFGDASSSGGYLGGSNVQLLASPYTVPAPGGTLTQIQFHVIGSSLGMAYVGLYDDNGGAPNNLLVQSTDAVAITAVGQTYSVDVPETSLSAGTYWLAIMMRPTTIGSGSFPGIPLETGNAYQLYMGSSWGSMPSPFGGSTYGNEVALVGVYCHN